MYEFLPELRRVPSDAYHHDEEDVEYDVFLYWPSRNELRQVCVFSRQNVPVFSTANFHVAFLNLRVRRHGFRDDRT